MEIDKYKLDERTKDEFIADMERGLEAEVGAIRTFRRILKNSNIESAEVVYVGSSEEGKISYNEKREIKNVDLFPDYLLKYKDNRRIRANFIEVKVCNPHSDECYFKVKQLDQYLELGNVLILFVMGYDSYSPLFALIRPEDIIELGIEPEKVYGKDTIKVQSNIVNWILFEDYLEVEDLLKRKYIGGN